MQTVFVVGAGASADFGYPLTRDLLFGLMPRLPAELVRNFKRVVRFHHPTWNGRPETIPDIEELLTEIAANADLLPTLRPGGPFGPDELQKTRDDILLEIAGWFHSIHEGRSATHIKEQLLKRIEKRAPTTVISFNWDLELDRGMFGEEPSKSKLRAGYGLESPSLNGPALLKPHGSLNWFPHETARYLKEDRAETLWEPSAKADREFSPIYCFRRWRAPHTKHSRTYIPWIVPPTHLKDFRHPMLKQVWARCVEALSTAKIVYFIGYSLPLADWHSRYIFRCGFHNQVDGLPTGKTGQRRSKPTGAARVVVINPDNFAFRRVETLIGRNCEWKPTTVAKWLLGG